MLAGRSTLPTSLPLLRLSQKSLGFTFVTSLRNSMSSSETSKVPSLKSPPFHLGSNQRPDLPGVVPMRDGHAVSRSSDFIMYSVEAEFIDKIAAEYGPCTYVALMNPFTLLLPCSHQGQRNRSWPDVRQGSGEGRLRETPPCRYSYRLLSLFARSNCLPGWPALSTLFSNYASHSKQRSFRF